MQRRHELKRTDNRHSITGPGAGLSLEAGKNFSTSQHTHCLKKAKIIEGVDGLRIMDDVGIKIHRLKHLKLHGKMLLADGSRAIAGSINLATGGFDDRRELAIEVRDDDIVDRLDKIARYDWEHSHPMELTDEGLFTDLEEHGGGAEKLVLRIDDEREKKHKK